MKKNYIALTMLMLFGSITTFAQLRATSPHKKTTSQNNFSSTSSTLGFRNGHQNNHTATIIWSDDFSVPSNWSIAPGSGTTDNWTIGTAAPGGPPYNIAPIMSTSAVNNFALFDSNVLCSGNQIGNLTNTTAINCSGHANVGLSFEQYYRKYYDSTYVYVSNNGTTWTKFTVNANVVNNGYSNGNPETVKLNISSVAGNQATVYIRFTFYSPSTLNVNAGCGYAWMVDDVELADLPGDDIAIVDNNFPSEYTVIPLSQVQPLNLNSKIFNNGLNVATNSSVSVDVYLNSLLNNVFSATSSVAATLNPGDTSAALTAGPYTPTDTGVYIIRFIANMSVTDADLSNDTLYRFVIVDTSGYARDYADISGSIDNSLGVSGVVGRFGQVYDIYSAAATNSVDCYLGAPILGDHVSASVYAVAGGIPTTLLGTSSIYTIAAGDTAGTFLTLNFGSVVPLPVGLYVVTVNQLDTNNLTLGFTNNVYTPFKVFYKIGPGAWGAIDTAGFKGAFLVRPNIIPAAVGINQLAQQGNVDVFPNPSNGIIHVMNMGIKEWYTISVYNPVGQLVYSQKYNELTNASVDLSNQPLGMYNVRIENDKGSMTKSILLTNK